MGYIRRSIEPETLSYNALAGASTDWFAINENIKAIKYGSGIVLSSLTAKLSLVSGYYFVTQSSVDLRPYALISGVQFSFSDGSKTAVYSGTFTAGTGETLGDELVTNGNMETGDPPSNWTPSAGATLTRNGTTPLSGTYDANVVTTNSAVQGIKQQLSVSNGDLLKVSGKLSIVSGRLSIFIGTTEGSLYGKEYYYKIGSQSATFFSSYGTNGVGAYLWVSSYNLASNYNVDDLSVNKVLTPSTSGFLSSALTVESGFDPNAASFTVTITRP